ncbi:ThiF family adenylyltransferase [Nodularia spumigena]|uniref:ThiF family adenylyltransferase n=1 Tax=Nodularia spumigena TaxID=70799 RepID=UPI002B21FD3C|nr:ThiF family adenylyltransferase [Nodularia spumigena]MEA5559074.1 ThiF family adenylyltransferase [Nodularia spumigena CH309]
MIRLKPFLTITKIEKDSVSLGTTGRYRVTISCAPPSEADVTHEWLLSDSKRLMFLEKLGLILEEESEWTEYDSRTLSFLSLFSSSPSLHLNCLRSQEIFILGCGGLGSRIALDLSALRPGHIHLIDPDIIDISNLSRMFYFTEQDVGRSKVAATEERIKVISPETQVSCYECCLLEWWERHRDELQENSFLFLTADGNDGAILSDFPSIPSGKNIKIMLGGYWEATAIIGPIFSSSTFQPGLFYKKHSSRDRFVRDFIPPSIGALNSLISGIMQIEYLKSYTSFSILESHQLLLNLETMHLSKVLIKHEI